MKFFSHKYNIILFNAHMKYIAYIKCCVFVKCLEEKCDILNATVAQRSKFIQLIQLEPSVEVSWSVVESSARLSSRRNKDLILRPTDLKIWYFLAIWYFLLEISPFLKHDIFWKFYFFLLHA